MGWNGLKRDRLDFILTDLLPVELSELFSFSSFYSFLLEKKQKQKLDEVIKVLKVNKTVGNMTMFENGWSTKPLKYNILKDNSTREMSIIQPISAINVFLFMECYQKDILIFFNKKHDFSIRYHKNSKNLYYKTKAKKITQYFLKQAEHIGRDVIQQTGCYFKITPFESINAFADSREWRTQNFKYKYYAKMDYKSCFDSIYSHAYSWIIERNVIDSKNAKNSSLFITIDRILMNINGRSSNGLIVGPEFSRMIAELLLQEIDYEVRLSLARENLIKGEAYSAYRYVDDIFIFAHDTNVIDKVIEKFSTVGKKYLLRLNELKLDKGSTPCLPKEWLEQTRNLADVLRDFFYKGTKNKFDLLPDDDRHLIKNDWKPIDRIKDEISELMKKYPNNRRTIVSFLMSTLLNNIRKKQKGFTLFREKSVSNALLILNVSMFIYAWYPAFEQTRKIISIISFMNDEVHFKDDDKAHAEFCRDMKKYNFILQSGNLFDVCDWFPFLLEYNVHLDIATENILISKAVKLNNPIIWANILMYSQYYKPFFNDIKRKVENIVEKEISKLIINKEPFLQGEIWYILIFHNCPFLSDQLKIKINDLINKIKNDNKQNRNQSEAQFPSLVVFNILCDFLLKKSSNGNSPEKMFFDWRGANHFGEQITYRTYQRTIFKNYHNKQALYASID